jgi:lysophospholipase L1-like esterase
MTPLIHNYSRKAGRISAWDTSDNKEFYEKNLADPTARQRLQDLGFIDRPIEYRFNSHGFRTYEFDRSFDAVCFGCSFTMGTGVHNEDTWPQQLETLTGLNTANLGHAGSSNDTAFRFAQHYLKFLRPRYAIWLQTDRHRLELLNDAESYTINILAGDTANPCANDYFIKTWFINDSNQQLNLLKNTMAFEHVCSELGITPIVLTRDMIPPHPPFPYGQARDLTHPGADAYKNLAQQVKKLLDGPTSDQSV